MKLFTLDEIDEIDFSVLAIHSHVKGHKLCWEINQKLQLNFFKNKYHIPENAKTMEFPRFTHKNEDLDIQYDLVANHIKNGYLTPNFKNVDFFLKIQNPYWDFEKQDFLQNIKQVSDILLIFELDLKKINSISTFIFCDKEN